MKRTIRTYIDKLPYVRDLRAEVTREGRYPAGHHYSPIPAADEVLASMNSRGPLPTELPGIDLNAQGQLALLTEYSEFWTDMQFPKNQQADSRYYYSPNYLFDYEDAFFLYSFLRKTRPRRIVEIGSGYSSAVILDTVDSLSSDRPQITFIEPRPSRLERLLRQGDSDHVRILPEKVQQVTFDVFSSLESGDLLFIDSSHQLKCGSDFHKLLLEVLPVLPPGTFVHFHDIFYPFEYPVSWLNLGMYFNEAYCLRAFLSYNSAWSIYFFNSYVDFAFGDIVRERMPLCAENPAASSLYLRKEHG